MKPFERQRERIQEHIKTLTDEDIQIEELIAKVRIADALERLAEVEEVREFNRDRKCPACLKVP